MFCLFYIPRVRMGCWFELKREKVFLDHILANYLNSYSFTERRKNITFYLKRRSVPSRNFKRTKNVKFCFGLFAKQYFSKYWAEFKRRLVNFWMMIWSIISQRTRTVLLKGKHLKNIIFLKRRSVPQMSNFVLEEFLPFKNSQIRRCHAWKKDWWRCRIFFSVQKWVVRSSWSKKRTYTS